MGKKCPLKTVALAVDKKKKQSKVVGVELRAGGGLHEPEKPGWSAGDMVKYPGNQMKIQQQNETSTNEDTQHQK